MAAELHEQQVEGFGCESIVQRVERERRRRGEEEATERRRRNMSAIVCGKRSIFEELPSTSPVSKRIRFSSSSTSPSSSPARFSPPKSSPVSVSASSNQYPFGTPLQSSQLLDYLRGIFPDMDPQVCFGIF